jgi:hypothetical protein
MEIPVALKFTNVYLQIYVTKEFLKDYKDPFGRWWVENI